MKSFGLTLIAAAALTVMAGVASAQSFKADIPFSFSAGGTVMPPGEYKIFRDFAGTSSTLRLVNEEAGRVVAVLLASRRMTGALDPSNLVFRCGDGNCALVRVSTPYWGYDLNAPKHAGNAPLASIRLSQ